MVFRFYFGGEDGYICLRDYMKNGSDFVKELSSIFGEWGDLESQYSKSLIKLASKLNKSASLIVGSMPDSWSLFGNEIIKQAELHQLYGQILQNEILKTIKHHLTARMKSLKTVEMTVEKCSKNLKECRHCESKAKKLSIKENQEREALHQASLSGTDKKGKPLPEKELAKMENKKSGLNTSVFKADHEYYDLSVRAEIAREETEAAIFTTCDEFQKLEIDHVTQMRAILTQCVAARSNFASSYSNSVRLVTEAYNTIDAVKDLKYISEQKGTISYTPTLYLPDFFVEDFSFVMDENRRRISLQNISSYVSNDLNREIKGIEGMKRLSLTFSQSSSKEEIVSKINNTKTLILYLELTKFKICSMIATIDKTTQPSFESSDCIQKSKDKSGQTISTYTMPTRIYENIFGSLQEMDINLHLSNMQQTSTNTQQTSTQSNSLQHNSSQHNSLQRTSSQHNSLQPNSSQHNSLQRNSWQNSSGVSNQLQSYSGPVYNNIETSSIGNDIDEFDNYTMVPICRCVAIYDYEAKEEDEISISAGTELIVYNKQSDGWWYGEQNGRVGLFPAAYVQIR